MSASELENLQRMANQIAANFSFHEDQVERIADHFTRFWAPSMRQRLAEHVDRGGDGLDPAVHRAVGKLNGG